MAKVVGFSGLGQMGGGMARRLIAGGERVFAFDPSAEALKAVVDAGATPATGMGELVERCDVVHTSLPSPQLFVQVYEREVLPRVRAGQVFVDHTTAQLPDVRRLSTAIAERGATLLDAPVSGGAGGAAKGQLRIFVGGDQGAFDRLQSHFAHIGDNVTWCGPSGAGQIVKIVNQLGMGLATAVLLEALAVGVRGGVDPAVLAKAVGSEKDVGEPWRKQLYYVAHSIKNDKARFASVKEAQLDDFLADAAELGIKLPITQAVADACRGQEKIVREANRMAASYWQALGMDGAKDA